MLLVNNLLFFMIYGHCLSLDCVKSGYYCPLVNPAANFEYKSNAGSTGNHTYKYMNKKFIMTILNFK